MTTQPFLDIIRTVPNFPKAGIDFYDIMPLLSAKHLPCVSQAMLDIIDPDVLAQADCFVGVEARGFVLATALSLSAQKGLILIRKQGKLPPPVYRQSYSTEYSCDTLEISQHITPCNVIIVDDVLATGGTLKTSIRLATQAGHHVLGSVVLMDLTALHTPIDKLYSVIKL